jgi:hypothetical protein
MKKFVELKNFKGGMTWYLKDCVIKMLNSKKDTVTIYSKGNKSVFMLFNNFDKNDNN